VRAGHRAHPQLPSLPTRRSSDLDLQSTRTASTPNELMITILGVVNDPVRTVGKGAWAFGRLMEQMVPLDPANPQANIHAAAWMRSEEHTSELQSRENLVCRLLLE